MRDLNLMLEEFIPVPRSISQPNLKYNSILPEDLECTEEELKLFME